MEYKFCSQCGASLTEKALSDRVRLCCPACGFIRYENPVPAAAVTLVRNGEILLVRRALEPKEGLWSLPAGFLEIDETVQGCAIRETKEETNLDIELAGLVGVYSVFDDPRYICLLVVFSGKILAGELRCGDDASEVAFFPPSALPEMAFDVHRRAIKSAFRRE